MIRLILFGSAHSRRRNQTGWSDPAPIRHVLATLRPDVVIHGASPGGGADELADVEAHAAGIQVDPCPVDHALDGPWPAAGHRRNERMDRDKRPHIGAGFVVGRVGSPLTSGSAGMARILRARGVPVVVYREDGVELAGGLGEALVLVRGLWRLCPAVEPAGRALRAAWEAERAGSPEVNVLWEGARAEVALVAREWPRFGPWLGTVG